VPPLAFAAAVGGLWTVAVVTPGPNFLAAARIAAGRDRRAGLAAVLGIGAGTLLWGLAGCLGVRAMFALAPWLFGALKLFAASFKPVSGPAAAPSRRSAVWLGFLTSVSNPKSALFVAALFASVLPPDAPLWVGLSAAAEMVAISLGWYGLVVLLLSTRAASAAYLRGRRWIDRLAGAVFAAFGARLLLERA
jgi:threonine/homoserine/homoserine lactone efflux protein